MQVVCISIANFIELSLSEAVKCQELNYKVEFLQGASSQ